MTTALCAKCGVDGKFTCSKCNVISYCGVDCQRKSWNDHKVLCKKYYYEQAAYADGMLKNTAVLTFLAALLKRFDAYGTNRGFIRCNVFRTDIDGEYYYGGKITYIARPCEVHTPGKNMVEFKYIAYNLSQTKHISFTNPECAAAYDAHVKAGKKLSAIAAGQAVKFCCNQHDHFEIVANGLDPKA